MRLAFKSWGAIRSTPTSSERAPKPPLRIGLRFFIAQAAANVLGGVVVFVFLTLILPDSGEVEYDWALFRLNLVAFAGYMLVTLPLARRWTISQAAPINRWLSQGRSPTANERELTLRFPLLGLRLMAPLWGAAAVIFGVLNAFSSLGLGARVGFTIALGGLTTCALAVLLAERMTRDAVAWALASGVPDEPIGLGVRTRMVVTWAVATGVALFGLLLVSAAALLGAELSTDRLAVTALFLGALGLSVGLLAIWAAASSVADPVEEVREALAKVERGNLEADAPVTDGSEVGLLAAGFNRMVGGLREREQLREAFGAYVDPDLADRVLREGTDLAGEEVEVSILFMDVRGFTTYSERASAREVVAKLNELYGQVVPVIVGHGGHANKFIGDGLLAVFGAPERLEDHAEHAVAAAREIAALAPEDGGTELRVGVGVNSGPVMAGTIGGGGRLDFTVIGDTVNTAARVEAATRQTGDDLLITEATLAALTDRDAEWVERGDVTLKGKAKEVRLYAPAR